MDTLQIKQIVSSLYPLNKIFQGIYPIDHINRINLQEPTACIVNTAPSTHKGEHWIAIICIKGEQEYFDSYGLPPIPEIKRMMRRPLHFNKKQIQDVFVNTCGAHCIYYLYHRCKGYTMKDIVKVTDDRKVTAFVNGIYSPDSEFDDLIEVDTINQISRILSI